MTSVAELMAALDAARAAERERSRELGEERTRTASLLRAQHGLERRIAALEAALAGERRKAAVVEATSDYVGIADLSGHSLYTNEAGLRLVGRSRQEMEGHSVLECYPERLRERALDMVLSALTGEVWSGEMALRCGDGRELPVSEVTFALRDAAGQVESLATIIRPLGGHRPEARPREQTDAVALA